MKKTVRLTALFCACLLLFGIVGCVDLSDDTDETTVLVDGAETTDSNLDANGYEKDGVPNNLNFGKTVSIACWNSERVEFEILEEERDGDIVTEAIYERNMNAEERLGIDLDWYEERGSNSYIDEFVNAITTKYNSGTSYDIIATYSRTAGSLLMKGFLQDINAIDDNYIDTDKPWWPARMLDTCSIDDSLYFVSGDISTNLLHFMYCIYYNLELLDRYNLEDPVDLVDNKSWTIDALIEMTKDIYVDDDGSQKPSEGDYYGFCSIYYHLDAFYTGSGLRLVERDEDKTLVISEDFSSSKAIDLCDKLGDWLTTDDCYISTKSNKMTYAFPFVQGKALFCQNRVYLADTIYGLDNGTNLNSVDWEYGILPTPLYDENQEDYITVVGNPITLWCVMEGAPDPSMSTAVIEVLCSEAYRKTSPALFETNMKYRYTPDTAGTGDSARMFDLIRRTIDFDLGRIFSQDLDYMSEMPSHNASLGLSWSRTCVAQSIALEKKLEKIVDAIVAFEEN